jgi:hypothetical protein
MLAVGGAMNLVRTFLFNGSAEVPFIDSMLSPVPTSIMDLAWHPNGQYIAVLGKDATNYYYYILRAGYVPPVGQAMTNSIVFGNSALGSNSDLNVQLLGGAHVEVRGKMLDDSL